MLVVVGYLSYTFFDRGAAKSSQLQTNASLTGSVSPDNASVVSPGTSGATTQTKPSRVVQLDVLNGCGAKGAGNSVMKFLRTNGFDVVEMKNYKSFHVPQTLVVDRVGNLAMARQVAAALGVSNANVIQQINPDYYVDVSVIIGKDYAELKGLQSP